MLTVSASKRRYEMCALPEARPLLSGVVQRAAPSGPLVQMVKARFIPDGEVPTNEITSPCH